MNENIFCDSCLEPWMTHTGDKKRSHVLFLGDAEAATVPIHQEDSQLLYWVVVKQMIK